MDNRTYNIYKPTNSAYQYIISESSLNLFISKLVDGTITQFDVQGFFQNNNDYVSSITFFPFNISFLVSTGTAQTIVIGKAQTTISANPITSQNAYVQIGSFTRSRRYNNYLDFSPYTKMTLCVPFFEPIEIDTRLIYGNTMYIYLSIDSLTGKGTIYVTQNANGRIVATKSAQLGIVVPLGKSNEQEQTRNNILQGISLIGSLGSLVFGASTGNGLAIAGGLALTTKTATTLIQNNIDAITGYQGMQGSRDGLCVDKTIRIIEEYPDVISVPDVNIMGKPCMKNVTLSSCSKFTRVQQIHFNPMNESIYQDEIQEIVSLLKDGVIF